MGVLQWVVQPLSVFTITGVSFSGVYDVMDAQEVHGLFTGSYIAAGSLAVEMQTSIDGINWSSLGSAFTTYTTSNTAAMAYQVVSVTSAIYRYVRFRYNLTTGPVTFGTQLFVKTTSSV